MGLIPSKQKFRKHQRRRLKGCASRGNTLHYGEFGLQSEECVYLTTNQIESARKAMTHFFKRGGKIWLRVCADKVVTARAAETRMGGGKGAPVKFVVPIKRGHIIFEIAGVSLEDAKQAFTLASYKLPMAVKLVVKQ